MPRNPSTAGALLTSRSQSVDAGGGLLGRGATGSRPGAAIRRRRPSARHRRAGVRRPTPDVSTVVLDRPARSARPGSPLSSSAPTRSASVPATRIFRRQLLELASAQDRLVVPFDHLRRVELEQSVVQRQGALHGQDAGRGVVGRVSHEQHAVGLHEGIQPSSEWSLATCWTRTLTPPPSSNASESSKTTSAGATRTSRGAGSSCFTLSTWTCETSPGGQPLRRAPRRSSRGERARPGTRPCASCATTGTPSSSAPRTWSQCEWVKTTRLGGGDACGRKLVQEARGCERRTSRRRASASSASRRPRRATAGPAAPAATSGRAR